MSKFDNLEFAKILLESISKDSIIRIKKSIDDEEGNCFLGYMFESKEHLLNVINMPGKRFIESSIVPLTSVDHGFRRHLEKEYKNFDKRTDLLVFFVIKDKSFSNFFIKMEWKSWKNAFQECVGCKKIVSCKKCSICYARYCSVECQRKNWKDHKLVCKK